MATNLMFFWKLYQPEKLQPKQRRLFSFSRLWPQAYFLNAAASIATTLTWSNFADQKYCYQWTTHKEKYLEQFTEGSGVCPWFIHNSCATAAGLGLGRTQWSPCMWGRWRRRRPRYSNLRRQNSVGRLPSHTQWFTVVYRTIGYHLDTATTENSRPCSYFACTRLICVT